MNTSAQSSPLKGLLYSLGGTILVSTNYVTAKYGLKGFNPETFSLVWTSAAAVYAFLIVLATGRRRQLALPAHSVIKMVLVGFATGVGMILGWHGLSRLDPSFAAFLWRFAPMLTILLGVMVLNERFLGKELIAIGIMVLGGCVSAIGRWQVVGIGTILTLLACCIFGVQRLLAKMLITEIHPNILVFYRVSIGVPVIALWAFLTGKADFEIEAHYLLVTLVGAFLGPCAGHILLFHSYRHWDLSRSTIISIAEPLFVLPLAYVFLRQFPAEKEVLGGCLILSGAFWLAWLHFVKKTGH